ncbi:MAG: phospholipid carrier-dependent glycosyltransferase, partial [Chloroflexi bacterium]|nr:phospholipid carrier-dependent glycosyltransferase [Chloroflexota bacterium]
HSLIFMLLILLIAAALRLPDLPDAPPGLHYDEAANGTLAADIGLRGDRPIFISSYTGKETLFFYLAGGLMRLVGDSVFTLRLTAAFVGLLTVAATYWLGREALRDRRAALLAAALLAVSFWHLLFSRLGFRAIAQPLLQALMAAALLRGLRRERWGWLAVSGLFLGLTAYTYLAARLFPVILLLAALPLLLNRQTIGLRWRQLGLTTAVALLVLSPLLGYFIVRPDAFWVRIGQAAPVPGGLSLGESYLKSLQMFFLVGDPYWRFNVPLRPLFNWFWGGLLVVGWAVLALRWRRLESDWRRAATLLLLLTPFLMILPTALATNEIVPSNLRAIGLIPFIFYLPAIGLTTLLDDLAKRGNGFSAATTTLAVIFLLLVGGGWLARRDYFQTWAAQPELYYESDGDLTAVAQFLDEIETENKTLYVAALHYQHPTLAFLSEKYGQIKWLPKSQALVFPARGAAIYVYPHNSPLPDWAAPFLESAKLLPVLPAPTGELAFAAYEMAAPPEISVPNPINAQFGDAVTLLGYEVDPGAADVSLPLTLYWRIEGAPTADFTPFVHLEDAWGHRWGQAETFAYPAPQWELGETVIQRVAVSVPPGTPPGAYRLRVGLFAAATGERLPRLDEAGRYAGDSFIIENAAIQPAPPPERLPQPPFAIDEPVRSGLRLLGYERGAKTAVTGETVGLGLWWLAGQSQPHLTTRLELRPALGSTENGPGIILIDTQPVHGLYPFANWQTPLFLIDRADVRIPNDVAPGDYHLFVRIFDAADEMLFAADLGPLTIEASERIFAPPSVERPLDITFSGEIALLGYDLEPVEDNRFALTLVWQAITPPADDYTVFVHLLGLDGVCCLWQADMMPRQN